jgi:hypothetical protein
MDDQHRATFVLAAHPQVKRALVWIVIHDFSATYRNILSCIPFPFGRRSGEPRFLFGILRARCDRQHGGGRQAERIASATPMDCQKAISRP